jgi:hypothetical protein
MSVASSNAYSGPLDPNGVTVAFPFTFDTAPAGDELAVVIDGDEVDADDYTVTVNAGGNGGTVTFSVAPIGDTLYIVSVPDLLQEATFENAGAFLPSSHDAVNDRQARRAIYLKGLIDRALLAPLGESPGLLPDATERAETYLAFDEDGDPMVGISLDAIEDLQQDVVDNADAIAAVLAAGMPVGASMNAVNRGVLAGLATTLPAYLTEEGREGMFTFEAGDFSDEVDADPEEIAYVAPNSDVTGASGAWVRNTEEITPRMAGATVYDPADEAWVHEEVQAFFDLAHSEDAARRFVFNFEGEWGVADRLYAAYWDGGEPNVERRFKCGTFRVAALADLPSGLPLDVVLDAAAPRSNWEGTLAIHPAGNHQYNDAYAARRYKTGLRRRSCSASKWGDIKVDAAIYEGVDDDSSSTGAGFTVRAGSDYERTFLNSSNISMITGPVATRYCGAAPTNAGGPSEIITLKEQGGNSAGIVFGVGEVWDSNPAYFSHLGQRTRITVGSTAKLRVNDPVWTRLVLTPAIYGTLAADNGAKTFTWTAGDPTDYLEVGDEYPLFLDGGVNANGSFRIIGFSGTSNRVIEVDAAPVTHAATASATYTHYSRPTFHLVSKIEDATHALVYPWIPDRNNSPLYLAGGSGLRINGVDSATGSYESLYAFACGVGVSDTALYAPKIGVLLTEACEVGSRVGNIGGDVRGIEVSAGHAEGNREDVLMVGGLATGRIAMQSFMDFSKVHSLAPRATSNSQDMVASSMGAIEFQNGGQSFHSHLTMQVGFEGDKQWYEFFGISNNPAYREAFIHTDTFTVPINYDRDVARAFSKNHWARIIWTDTDGSDPDGTGTLELNDALVEQGWTFAGAGAGASYAIANPATSVILELQYLEATKKVVITRLNAA